VNPQVESPPAICQKAWVCMASPTLARSPAALGAAAAAGTVPSGPSPIASGESRTTHTASGIITTNSASAITPKVSRHPSVRISHMATGTSMLIPAMEAPPSSPSAVARRRVNQRETTAEATTGPVAARPSAISTPQVR